MDDMKRRWFHWTGFGDNIIRYITKEHKQGEIIYDCIALKDRRGERVIGCPHEVYFHRNSEFRRGFRVISEEEAMLWMI